MSLLLLFPSGAAVSTCFSVVATTPTTWSTVSTSGQTWSVVSTTDVTWTLSHYDFYNIWGEWGTSTWGALAASGYTWGYLAGYTFVTVNTNATTWTTTSVGTCGAA